MDTPSSARQVADFEQWLRSDPANLAAYESSDRIARLGQRLPVSAATTGNPVSRTWRTRAAAVVLVGLVALGLGGLWLNNAASPAFATVVNHGKATKMVALRDGTIVTLDAMSTIEVAVPAERHAIRVVSGRARFVTNLAAGSDLTISTPSGTILTRDATIDVALVENDMQVRLWRGSAKFDVGSGTLTSVVGGSIFHARGGVVVQAQDLGDSANWVLARTSFDNAPIARVLALANRTGSPKVFAATPDIAALTITAVLDLRDTRALAHKLAAAEDLKVSQRSDVLVLTR